MKQGLDVVPWERCLDDSNAKGKVRMSIRRAAETRIGWEGGEQRTGSPGSLFILGGQEWFPSENKVSSVGLECE